MKLIVGLGNPDAKYHQTRHNIGFGVLDMLASADGLSWKHAAKFHADIAEKVSGGEKTLLVKPTTYYNLVGESIRAIADFYKVSAEDILIIHDDLALPLGTIRTRLGGSDGGNNGLKSLNAHIGPNTHRIRVGVWVDHHETVDKVGIVLGKLSQDEQAVISSQHDTIKNLVDDFSNGRFDATTHRIAS